ncbi:MAG: helix-turn-helix transcriptional regulator [Clostridia bacterium]|nr:helix-turn-helix transcriptional regulator [Clostridia bacterium]
MKSRSYYSFEDRANGGLNMCSRASSELPIVVNCAGAVSIDERFTTYNSRGRDDYYLMYIEEGRLQVELDGEVKTVTSGDVIIFPPKYKYRYTLTRGHIGYYFIHFSGSYAEKLIKSLGINALPCAFSAGHSSAVADGFSALFDAYSREDDFFEHLLGIFAAQIIVNLVRLDTQKENKAPLVRSISHIKTFYTEPIKIPDLAAMEGLSVSRYNTVFRETTGTSPVKYITDLRMKHAASLLLSTNISAARIGAMVGYEDNHFFSKAFKKYCGLSPKAYRERKTDD